jgi:drug/metabolite transporter (DMT)-like permease
MALMVVIARRNPEIPTMPAGIASGLLTITLCLPFISPDVPPPGQMALLAGFGVVNSTLAFSLFLMGSRRIAPIETALLGALEAPIAPLWVWAAYGETPTLATVAGGGVVFVAVFWHVMRQYRAG